MRFRLESLIKWQGSSPKRAKRDVSTDERRRAKQQKQYEQQRADKANSVSDADQAWQRLGALRKNC